MADIQRTRTIAARPQEVWDVLADFGAIAAWAGNVDHSCILNRGPDGESVGATRRVQIKRDVLVERITEFDPPRSLGYDIEGLPTRPRRVSNRWTIGGGDGSTVVTLTSSVDIGARPAQRLAERALCRVLARQSDAMLAGLADRLEDLGV